MTTNARRYVPVRAGWANALRVATSNATRPTPGMSRTTAGTARVAGAAARARSTTITAASRTWLSSAPHHAARRPRRNPLANTRISSTGSMARNSSAGRGEWMFSRSARHSAAELGAAHTVRTAVGAGTDVTSNWVASVGG